MGMDELEIQTAEGQNGTRIVKVKGALTLKDLFQFQDLVRQEHAHGLIIDLAEVSYMDSAALGAILGAYASCERTGRGFGIAGISERVLTLFKVAGVDKLVPKFDSVEAAEQQFATKAGR